MTVEFFLCPVCKQQGAVLVEGPKANRLSKLVRSQAEIRDFGNRACTDEFIDDMDQFDSRRLGAETSSLPEHFISPEMNADEHSAPQVLHAALRDRLGPSKVGMYFFHKQTSVDCRTQEVR